MVAPLSNMEAIPLNENSVNLQERRSIIEAIPLKRGRLPWVSQVRRMARYGDGWFRMFIRKTTEMHVADLVSCIDELEKYHAGVYPDRVMCDAMLALNQELSARKRHEADGHHSFHA